MEIREEASVDKTEYIFMKSAQDKKRHQLYRMNGDDQIFWFMLESCWCSHCA